MAEDPENSNDEMIRKASKLIRAYEVAGGVQDEDAIKKAFSRAVRGNGGRAPADVSFPSKSGATLGFGHDIGQSSDQEIDAFYGPTTVGSGAGSDYGPQGEVLSAQDREVLKTFVGKPVVKAGKGSAAFIATKDVHISYDQATEVFEKHLLPKYVDATRKAFPGFDDLPVDQQAAIVDRVYMRGPGINKAEGKKGAIAWTQLHDAIFKRDTYAVYAALKNMEGLHKKSTKSSSTQGRARANTALAYEGYLETTQMTHR
jgi:hypothetical protein